MEENSSIKSFTIDWEGRKEIIEYETEIEFGAMEDIIKASINLDTFKPKVNVQEYRMQVLRRVLRKAPFDYSDPRNIRKVKAKYIKSIIMEVMEDYPLALTGEDLMPTLLGSEDTSSESTKSSQPADSSSDGPQSKPDDKKLKK